MSETVSSPLSAPKAMLAGFEAAIRHLGLEAIAGANDLAAAVSTPEGKELIDIAKGFAMARGVPPEALSAGASVVEAAYVFAKAVAADAAGAPA